MTEETQNPETETKPEVEAKVDLGAKVAEELQEKKVKKAFIEKFRPADLPQPENSEVKVEVKAVSDEEAVNQIYQDLAQVKKEAYFEWKIKITSLLWAFGLIILALWLVSGSRWGIESFLPQYAFWNPEMRMEAIEAIAAAKITPTPEASPAAKLRIRIRDNSENETLVKDLENWLRGAGFNLIEVVDDHESEYQGVSIVTRNDDQQSRDLIVPVLSRKYELASPSAELSPESDFDVVVLFAPLSPTATPSAKPSPTATPKAASSSAETRPASTAATLQ